MTKSEAHALLDRARDGEHFDQRLIRDALLATGDLAAASKTDHGVTFIRECANWEEHQRWNAQRVGMYAQMPVTE